MANFGVSEGWSNDIWIGWKLVSRQDLAQTSPWSLRRKFQKNLGWPTLQYTVAMFKERLLFCSWGFCEGSNYLPHIRKKADVKKHKYFTVLTTRIYGEWGFLKMFIYFSSLLQVEWKWYFSVNATSLETKVRGYALVISHTCHHSMK